MIVIFKEELSPNKLFIFASSYARNFLTIKLTKIEDEILYYLWMFISLVFDGTTFQWINSVNYLGVQLDQKLHIHNSISKSNKAISALYY